MELKRKFKQNSKNYQTSIAYEVKQNRFSKSNNKTIGCFTNKKIQNESFYNYADSVGNW